MKNRLLVLIALFSLAGIIAISGCSLTNRSELQKKNELQKLKQAGLPTSIYEYIPPEIPDSENGALVYKEAFKVRDSLEQKYKTEWKLISKPEEYDKAPARDKKKITRVILNDPDFVKLCQLLEKASRIKCQFLKKNDYMRGIRMDVSHLLPINNCSGILATKSKVEAKSAMGDKALSTCLTGLKMAGFAAEESVLISQIVRMAMDFKALDALDEVINKGNSSPGLYSLLIKQMESERTSKKTQPALKRELVNFIDLCEECKLVSSNKSQKVIPEDIASDEEVIKELKKITITPNREFWNDQIVAYSRLMSATINLSSKPSYSEAIAKIGYIDAKIKELPPVQAFVLQICWPSSSNILKQETRVNAYLGAAEIGLANRLYKTQYGKFADSPSQLVPEFLQSLPLDPFTGKDYIYRKKDKGFVVYSLGENLKDYGGESQGIKSGHEGNIAWLDKGN